MTIEQLRASVEVEEEVGFWGSIYNVTPRLLSEVYGDGRQLVAFETFDTRPYYYVVMADSGWDLSNYSQGEVFVDHVGETLNALAEQFGKCHGDECEECGGQGCPFPALLDTTDCHAWGPYRDKGWTGPEVASCPG
jgi:hypothetical protein